MNLHKVIGAAARALKNRRYRVNMLRYKGLLNWMPDKLFLKYVFHGVMGTPLNLNNPETFNAKLQWLKLYNRNPEYTMMVDKYRVREYIKEQLGEEYLIPLFGVWDDPDEIDFDALPDQFVLKCNHNSGLGMCICKDKSKLDIPKVKAKLRKGMAQDYYLTGREWPYKDVPRKIICEKYMTDESGTELKDYKFMCFVGKVKCSFVCSERFSEQGLKVTFFDNDWNVLPIERHYPRSGKPIPKPQNLEKMIRFSEQLSRGIPFVRVDFYEICGRIYFGELTFFPGNGYEEFTPETADEILGSWINLPEEKE